MTEYEQIANECDKLEKIISTGLEEYGTTHELLSKKWYTIALENNDSDNRQDNSNKRNVLLRIVDRVIAFIKHIGQKIVAWYQRCKAAIVKFFGKKELNPKAIAVRFNMLVQNLSKEDIDKLIHGLNDRDKKCFAEILNDNYNTAFTSLYADYTHLIEKARDVNKLVANEKFFISFKEKATELKHIAEKNKIYENIDTALQAVLNGKSNSAASRLETIGNEFKEISTLHTSCATVLEKTLQDIPNYSSSEGNNEATQQELIKLVSDIIKIESNIVLKVNSNMHAVAELMTKISKLKFKKLALIPH